LGKYLEVLKEVQSCAHGTGKDIHAVTLMMMYEFAEPIDGVSALVRVGASKNCSQLLRTALEIGLGLRYVLEDAENYERRSLAYEYYHLLDALKWAQKCDPDHELGKQIRRELKDDELADAFDVTDKGIDIGKEVERHEKKVNSPRYAAVRAEIERIKDEKKKAKNEGRPFSESSADWYNLWSGPKDIRALAQRVKTLSTYEVLYRTWSNTAHGEGAMKRIAGRGADEMVHFEPIRSPTNLQEKCLHACHLTTGLTLAVVDKLVPHLRPSLQSWFAGNMTPAYDFINSVKIRG
jgi:hypothetical protein